MTYLLVEDLSRGIFIGRPKKVFAVVLVLIQSLIDGKTKTVVGDIHVGSSPFLAVNPKTNMVYVTNHHSDIVIDGKTNKKIKKFLWVHFLFISKSKDKDFLCSES